MDEYKEFTVSNKTYPGTPSPLVSKTPNTPNTQVGSFEMSVSNRQYPGTPGPGASQPGAAQRNTVQPAAAQPTPAQPAVPSRYSNTDAINALYDAQKAARAAELEAAYEQNRSNQQAAADRLPQQYQAQANDLAVQYERNKRNFNEQAVRSGINTGAGSQAELAQNAAWLKNYGNLRQAETDAQTEAQRQLNDLYNNYTKNLAAANAQLEAQRGAALIDERGREYSRDLDRAKTLADYGDFSGYAAIYGDDAARGMANIWAQQNPDIAYIVGSITKDQRDNIVSGRPINDGLDENGVRIVGASGGGSGGSAALSDILRNQAWSMHFGTNGSGTDNAISAGAAQALVDRFNKF